MNMDSGIPSSSSDAIASVALHYAAIVDAFPDAEKDFERRWAAWIAVCLAQAAERTSLDKCIETDEFELVRRLGPKIIPFVVFKLATDDNEHNFYGVFLYNALENDAGYRVEPDAHESPVSREALQHLSRRIVELNYQRNQIFDERARAWVTLHKDNWTESGSAIFVLCEEYWDLLEMGTSIIAPLMVEFSKFDSGYWFILLHEIIHGRQLGAHSYQRGVFYDQWVRWFNEGEHDEAPLYVPTKMDRYIAGGTFPWEPQQD